MHAAHGVVVAELRRALKGGLAKRHRYQREVQRFGDVRVGQFAGQHGLHDFQAGFASRHVRADDARFAAAGQHAGAHGVALFYPLSQ